MKLTCVWEKKLTDGAELSEFELCKGVVFRAHKFQKYFYDSTEIFGDAKILPETKQSRAGKWNLRKFFFWSKYLQYFLCKCPVYIALFV